MRIHTAVKDHGGYNSGTSKESANQKTTMEISEMTNEQLGMLLYKINFSRKSAKYFLHDIGVASTSESLAMATKAAEGNEAAVRIKDRLLSDRKDKMAEIGDNVSPEVDKMLSAVATEMANQGITQSQLAEICGWEQPLVSAYLNKTKVPGLANLCKMTVALGKTWILSDNFDEN